MLAWASSLVYSTDFGSGGGYTTDPISQPAEPVGLIVASAAWWLLVAFGLGLLALHEARQRRLRSGRRPSRGHDPLPGRNRRRRRNVDRADATGFAGRGQLRAPDRAVDCRPRPARGAAVLLERAFRRDSTAFVLPAALGLILAMTDFNFSYFADSTYVGLLIEGGILLVGRASSGTGFGRRLGRSAARPAIGGPSPPREAPESLRFRTYERRGRGAQRQRLVQFSDGVFTVALTLLVIDIAVPEPAQRPSSKALTDALWGQLPNIAAFALSFWVVGAYWLTHHRHYVFIQRYDGTLAAPEPAPADDRLLHSLADRGHGPLRELLRGPGSCTRSRWRRWASRRPRVWFYASSRPALVDGVTPELRSSTCTGRSSRRPSS